MSLSSQQQNQFCPVYVTQNFFHNVSLAWKKAFGSFELKSAHTYFEFSFFQNGFWSFKCKNPRPEPEAWAQSPNRSSVDFKKTILWWCHKMQEMLSPDRTMITSRECCWKWRHANDANDDVTRMFFCEFFPKDCSALNVSLGGNKNLFINSFFDWLEDRWLKKGSKYQIFPYLLS